MRITFQLLREFFLGIRKPGTSIDQMNVMDSYEGDNFVLDLQVVRAALKAYSRFVSAEKPSICNLSPSTQYLHLLLEPVVETTAFSWQDPGSCVHLLERRAVSLLRDLVLHDSDRDASVEERVSRAVTEAFVAEQIMAYIGDIQNGLPGKSAEVLRDLLHLVRLLYLMLPPFSQTLTYRSVPSHYSGGLSRRSIVLSFVAPFRCTWN